MSGDARYKERLDAAWDLHCRKANDYGSDSDPLANLREVERLGFDALDGVMIRLSDKWHRLSRWYSKRKAGFELANEGPSDTLRDISAYCLLADILLEEERRQAS